jgi:predicted DCC family thiol-disulfide oxidoreductase YuxK
VALQSEPGIFLRKKFALPEETDSVILWQNGRFYFYSESALIIAKHLNYPWPVLWIFKYVPLVVRDGIYKWIARNRYKWFGTRQVCRMPVGEERRLFPTVADLQLEIASLEPAKEV